MQLGAAGLRGRHYRVPNRHFWGTVQRRLGELIRIKFETSFDRCAGCEILATP